MGWIPPGASPPRPTPEHEEVLDLEIMEEGEGYVLAWEARPSPTIGDMRSGDSWYHTIDDALRGGLANFGIPLTSWDVLDR